MQPQYEQMPPQWRRKQLSELDSPAPQTIETKEGWPWRRIVFFGLAGGVTYFVCQGAPWFAHAFAFIGICFALAFLGYIALLGCVKFSLWREKQAGR